MTSILADENGIHQSTNMSLAPVHELLHSKLASLEEQLAGKELELEQAESVIRRQSHQIEELTLLSALTDSLKEHISTLKEKISRYEVDRSRLLELLKKLGLKFVDNPSEEIMNFNIDLISNFLSSLNSTNVDQNNGTKISYILAAFILFRKSREREFN